MVNFVTRGDFSFSKPRPHPRGRVWMIRKGPQELCPCCLATNRSRDDSVGFFVCSPRCCRLCPTAKLSYCACLELVPRSECWPTCWSNHVLRRPCRCAAAANHL